MDTIASFTVDHERLLRGIYLSRRDIFGGQAVCTFDIRVTRPNAEPVMNTAEAHTIEHLGATYLRNHPDYAAKTVYFGPMGCRTGFYWVLADDCTSMDALPAIIGMFEYIRRYRGDIPGASPRACGNYMDLNLPMARYWAGKYLDEVLYAAQEKNLNYPV